MKWLIDLMIEKNISVEFKMGEYEVLIIVKRNGISAMKSYYPIYPEENTKKIVKALILQAEKIIKKKEKEIKNESRRS